MSQPLCLWCGARIRKSTRTIRFKREPSQYDEVNKGWISYSYGPLPMTIAECQQRTNHKVVSVKRGDPWSAGQDQGAIWSCSTWDGESYVDEYFCNGDHAKRFGYAAAAHGLRLKQRSAA